MMRSLSAHIVVALVVSAVAGPAAADPPRHGPPGLVGKPHGMPPGQAKKLYRQGERLPATYLSRDFYLVEPARYRLRPAPVGYRWVIVHGDAYLVQTRTGLISDLVRALL